MSGSDDDIHPPGKKQKLIDEQRSRRRERVKCLRDISRSRETSEQAENRQVANRVGKSVAQERETVEQAQRRRIADNPVKAVHAPVRLLSKHSVAREPENEASRTARVHETLDQRRRDADNEVTRTARAPRDS